MEIMRKAGIQVDYGHGLVHLRDGNIHETITLKEWEYQAWLQELSDNLNKSNWWKK